MGKSRDQRLAEKLRAKQGDAYESASERRRRQSAEASSVSSPDPAVTYDQVRATPDSRQRRARARSAETISRWRRSVDDRWNR